MAVVTSKFVVPALGFALAAAGLLAAVGPASAQDARVRSACSGDYHRYCPAYPVGSTQLKSCMRAVGKRLSPACVDALVASGELSRKEAKRR